jgi:hypothetical protein
MLHQVRDVLQAIAQRSNFQDVDLQMIVGIPEIGDFKLCCFRDPDGIVLELVQASL